MLNASLDSVISKIKRLTKERLNLLENILKDFDKNQKETYVPYHRGTYDYKFAKTDNKKIWIKKYEIKKTEFSTPEILEPRNMGSNILIEDNLSRKFSETKGNNVFFLNVEKNKKLDKILSSSWNYRVHGLPDESYIYDENKNSMWKTIVQGVKELGKEINKYKLVPADKNLGVVVTNRQTYTELYEKCFNYETFPLNEQENVYSKTLLNIFNRNKITIDLDEARYKWVPNAFMQIKMHKYPIKGRTIINPKYKPIAQLSRLYVEGLNKIFEKLKRNKQSFYTSSIYHHYDKITKILNDNQKAKLGRYDVQNFYNEVIPEKVKQVLLTLVSPNESFQVGEQQLDSKTFINEVMEIVTNSSFIDKDNVIRKQKTGVSLGSILSPVLAEIFIEYHMQQQAKNFPMINESIFIFRRVDDMLVISLDENIENKVSLFMNKVSNATSLKIEAEEEINSDKCMFLGVSFNKKDGKWESTYKYKLPSINSFPHASSNESLKSKLVRMFGYFQKICYFTSNSKIKEEQLKELTETFKNKGYQEDMINLNIKRALLSLRKKYVDQMTEVPKLESMGIDLGDLKYNRFPTLFRLLQKRSYHLLNTWSRHPSMKKEKEKNEEKCKSMNNKRDIENLLKTDFFRNYII